MSVPTTTDKVIFTGDGVSSIFAISSFNIYLDTDLLVSIKNTTAATLAGIAAGQIATLVKGTDYTVALTTTPPTTSTLTLINSLYTSLPVGLQLIVQRSLPLTQLIGLTDNEKTPAATFQEAFDRAVMLVQQLYEVLTRTLAFDVSQTTAPTVPALAVGALYSDGAKLAWQALSTTATTFNGSFKSGADSLKAASPGLGDIYFATDTKKIYLCASAGTWSYGYTFDTATANALLLENQSSGPATSATQLGLYVKTVSSVKELFYRSVSSGAEIQLTSNGVLNPAIYTTVAPTTGSFKNLKIDSASNTTATVSADELIVDNGKKLTSLSVTLNTANAAVANGTDAGALGNNEVWYIYAIYKTADGSGACLASKSATAPTMPAGYAGKALISFFQTDGSAHIVGFRDEGRSYRYKTSQTGATGSPGTGSWTSIDTTKIVPSALSTLPYLILHTSVNQYSAMTNDSSVATGNTAAPNKIMVSSGGAAVEEAFGELMILTANTIYYLASGTGTVYVDGFYKNKL